MRLGDICSKIGSGATPRGGKEAYSTSGIPIIRSQNVLDWSFSSNGLAYLNDEQAKTLSNVEVHQGDILLNITGDSVARACIVPSDVIPARVNQHVAILRPKEKANATFILAWLQTNKDLLLKLASSGATRNALTKRMLEGLDINLPSIDIQNHIAELISLIQSKINLNIKLNGYLEELCECLAAHESGTKTEIMQLCSLVSEKVPCNEAVLNTYVSTESLLSDKRGRQRASSLPRTGKVTIYRSSDVLISNIRPYFKKIWFADCDGTCSGDVLVFRAKNPLLAPYLYSILHADSFFEFVMKGAKGTKMPRGDKRQMLTYQAASSPRQDTIASTTILTEQIAINDRENDKLTALRDVILPKLMSGEIDVSKIDFTQLNSHLEKRKAAASVLSLIFPIALPGLWSPMQ